MTFKQIITCFFYYIIGIPDSKHMSLHNDINVKHSLKLAASAYCPVSELNSWDCKQCKYNVSNITIIDDDTRIIMAYDEWSQSHFISVRGSSDINNWISNLDAVFTYPYPDNTIGVHSGLYSEYNKYKEQMYMFVYGLEYGVKLLLTGHSSGSILVSLLAYDLVNSGLISHSNIDLYTYGSPRMGNKQFMESFISKNISHSRITYKHDIVPHLPEEMLGYIHLPHEIWYNKDNEYKICHDDNAEDDSCSNSCSPFKCSSVDDHLNYLGTPIGSGAC